MKTSTIIRIVCWAIVAIFLIGVLAWGISGNAFRLNLPPVPFFGPSSVSFGRLTGEPGPYSPGNAYGVELGAIKNIDISWVAGSVTVAPYDGDTISFTESSTGGIEEKYALRYACTAETLTIHYCASSLRNTPPWWDLSKKLEVLVPRALADDMVSLSVDTVSASVVVSGLSGERANLESVSGSIEVIETTLQALSLDTTSASLETTDCAIESMQADSVSGAMKLGGAFGDVRTDSVSGSARVISAVCPARVRMSSVSGGSTLLIPENRGFTARYDSVSGGFSCEFPASVSEHSAVYADGSASFRFESVSGGIRIEKLD